MISVLIPTFNSEIYIHKTIKSVLDQSIQVDEIVIYDDASTDKTLNIIRREFSQFLGIRILENRENVGILRSRQMLIQNANGDIIFFLDHDDEWKKDYVKTVMETFLNTEHGMIVSAVERVNSLGNVIDKPQGDKANIILSGGSEFQRSVEYIFLKYPIHSWSCVSFKKDFGSLLSEIKHLHSGEEFCFASLILESSSVLLLNQRFVKYRVHSGNASSDAKKQFDTEIGILIWFLQKFPFLKMNLMQKTTSIFANALYRAIISQDKSLISSLFGHMFLILGNKKLYFLFFSPLFFLYCRLVKAFR